MESFIKKRKIQIFKLLIEQLERNLQFEIRLPNLVNRISGITISTVPVDAITDIVHVGIVTFQSNGEEDVFWKADVRVGSVAVSDEGMMGIEDANFDSDKPYVNGKGPKPLSAIIAGDSGIIQGWFRGTMFPGLFKINIYVQYEEADELTARIV